MEKSSSFSGKKWLSLVLFGLLGQVAWCIENSFLNLYLRRTITSNPIALSTMLAASAIVATLTTICVGLYSDKKGKRVPFMNWGYIIWGFTIMLFAFVTVKNMQTVFSTARGTAIILAACGVIFLDCVMTFFGSTANDACFSAWVTDNSNPHNRGRIEAVLSILAMVANAAVFAGFDGITRSTYYDADGNVITNASLAVSSTPGNWTLFFCLLGGMVTVIGVLGLFVNKDNPALKPDSSISYKDLLYGFKPSVIKKNKYYYTVLLCSCIYGIANNCFAGYLIIYFEYSLGIQWYILPFAVIYGASAVVGIIIGFILDKKGNKKKYLIPAVILYVIGAIFMYVCNPTVIGNYTLLIVLFCLFALIQNAGNSTASIVLAASLRDLTPSDRVGQFQGVRMVGYVMLPMVIGPMITALFITSQGDKYVYGLDEFGEKLYTCPPIMFLIAAFVVLLAIIPTVILLKANPKDLVINHGDAEVKNPD